MPPDEEDDLINKAIDEVLAKAESRDDELKKRRPKPFRYLTNEEDIKAELSQQDENIPVSVMQDSPVANIVEDKLAVLGLGDIETIENVIKKHQASRKFK